MRQQPYFTLNISTKRPLTPCRIKFQSDFSLCSRTVAAVLGRNIHAFRRTSQKIGKTNRHKSFSREQTLDASPPPRLPFTTQVHEARIALATFLDFVKIQDRDFLTYEECLLVGKMMEMLEVKMPCFEGARNLFAPSIYIS